MYNVEDQDININEEELVHMLTVSISGAVVNWWRMRLLLWDRRSGLVLTSSMSMQSHSLYSAAQFTSSVSLFFCLISESLPQECTSQTCPPVQSSAVQ